LALNVAPWRGQVMLAPETPPSVLGADGFAFWKKYKD
jgi:hypothetical protein